MLLKSPRASETIFWNKQCPRRGDINHLRISAYQRPVIKHCSNCCVLITFSLSPISRTPNPHKLLYIDGPPPWTQLIQALKFQIRLNILQKRYVMYPDKGTRPSNQLLTSHIGNQLGNNWAVDPSGPWWTLVCLRRFQKIANSLQSSARAWNTCFGRWALAWYFIVPASLLPILSTSPHTNMRISFYRDGSCFSVVAGLLSLKSINDQRLTTYHDKLWSALQKFRCEFVSFVNQRRSSHQSLCTYTMTAFTKVRDQTHWKFNYLSFIRLTLFSNGWTL